jgi:hypothetical protein
MSEQIGKLVTCVRCNNTVFLKYLRSHGGSNYSDPGYTRAEYEPLPETWLNAFDMGHLCPECSKKFINLLIDFFGVDVYQGFGSRWKIKED